MEGEVEEGLDNEHLELLVCDLQQWATDDANGSEQRPCMRLVSTQVEQPSAFVRCWGGGTTPPT